MELGSAHYFFALATTKTRTVWPPRAATRARLANVKVKAVDPTQAAVGVKDMAAADVGLDASQSAGPKLGPAQPIARFAVRRGQRQARSGVEDHADWVRLAPPESDGTSRVGHRTRRPKCFRRAKGDCKPVPRQAMANGICRAFPCRWHRLVGRARTKFIRCGTRPTGAQDCRDRRFWRPTGSRLIIDGTTDFAVSGAIDGSPGPGRDHRRGKDVPWPHTRVGYSRGPARGTQAVGDRQLRDAWT